MSESLDYPLQKKTIIVQIDFAKGKANSSSVNIFNEFKDLVVSSGAKIAYESIVTSFSSGNINSVKQLLDKKNSK